MGRRLILDTNLLIAYERGTIDRSSLDHDELAIASVSVAEYRVGIETADTAGRGAERARALAAITSTVDVLDYTQATAAHHGRLLAHVRRSGSPRGAHDLIIAAHAAETGRTILSRDAKARFGTLPGVTAIDAEPWPCLPTTWVPKSSPRETGERDPLSYADPPTLSRDNIGLTSVPPLQQLHAVALGPGRSCGPPPRRREETQRF